MTDNEPRDHHYVPQFYLRNFASDLEKLKIKTVAKHGDRAIWMERSIESLGFERDFYVHLEGDVPVSVETDINRQFETPISKSETWAKITEERTHELDQSDRAILYALVRHLEVRTPHALATMNELAAMAADPESAIRFSDEERSIYAELRVNPGRDRETLNFMSASTRWLASDFQGAMIMVMRSPIPLRTSTTPAMSMGAPAHEAISMPVPGMKPFQRVLPLTPTTVITVVDGAFGGAFSNIKISRDVALGFNRYRLGQFAHFPHVRHLVTGREGLPEEMTWAPYNLVEDTRRKITFRRRPVA